MDTSAVLRVTRRTSRPAPAMRPGGKVPGGAPVPSDQYQGSRPGARLTGGWLCMLINAACRTPAIAVKSRCGGLAAYSAMISGYREMGGNMNVLVVSGRLLAPAARRPGARLPEAASW